MTTESPTTCGAAVRSGDGLDGNRNNVWSTPQDLWDTLNAEFAFTLDVCALPWNAKCARYYTPDDDGLAQPWAASNWCNPPFDRSMAKWYQRAWDEAQRGNLTVCITKGDAHDTAYWHNYIMRASEIRYIRGRAKYRAPDRELAFRSVLIVFRPYCQGPAQIASVNRQGRVLPPNVEPSDCPPSGLFVSKRNPKILLAIPIDGYRLET